MSIALSGRVEVGVLAVHVRDDKCLPSWKYSSRMPGGLLLYCEPTSRAHCERFTGWTPS